MKLKNCRAPSWWWYQYVSVVCFAQQVRSSACEVLFQKSLSRSVNTICWHALHRSSTAWKSATFQICRTLQNYDHHSTLNVSHSQLLGEVAVLQELRPVFAVSLLNSISSLKLQRARVEDGAESMRAWYYPELTVLAVNWSPPIRCRNIFECNLHYIWYHLTFHPPPTSSFW